GGRYASGQRGRDAIGDGISRSERRGDRGAISRGAAGRADEGRASGGGHGGTAPDWVQRPARRGELGIRNLEFGIKNLEIGIWNSGSIPNSNFLIPIS